MAPLMSATLIMEASTSQNRSIPHLPDLGSMSCMQNHVQGKARARLKSFIRWWMTSSVNQSLKISGHWKNWTISGRSIWMNTITNKSMPVSQNTTKALEPLFRKKIILQINGNPSLGKAYTDADNMLNGKVVDDGYRGVSVVCGVEHL